MSDVPVENLTLEFFAPLVKTRFKVQASLTQAVELELDSASEIKNAGLTNQIIQEAFSLLFTGPENQFLPQGTYHFEQEPTGKFILFLVPVGPQSGLMLYQAVFNRVRRAA